MSHQLRPYSNSTNSIGQAAQRRPAGANASCTTTHTTAGRLLKTGLSGNKNNSAATGSSRSRTTMAVSLRPGHCSIKTWRARNTVSPFQSWIRGARLLAIPTTGGGFGCSNGCSCSAHLRADGCHDAGSPHSRGAGSRQLRRLNPWPWRQPADRAARPT